MGNGYHAVALREIGRLFGSGTAVGLSDAELLDRFASDRDEVAFAAIVDRHGPMVLGLCRRIVRDAHEAEDVFQAAFLVLARKAGAIRVDDSLGRWLYIVARRLALRVNADLARRDKLRSSDLAPISPSDDLERRERAAIIHDELDRLPMSYRNVVILCYLEGVTHEEAARRLRWPIGSVKGRLVRAREILKARLTRRGLALSSGSLAATLRPDPVSASLFERTLSAAIGFAASRTGLVPAVTLANGVLTTMLVSKLKLGATAVLALCVGAFATGAAGDGPTESPKSRSAAKTDPVRPKQEYDVNVDYPPGAVRAARPNEADNDREAIERLLQQLNAHRPETGDRTDALVSRITRELRTLHADVEKTDDEIMRLKRANESKMNQIAKLERLIETASAARRIVRPRVDQTTTEPPASKRAERQPPRIDLYGNVTVRESGEKPSDTLKPRVVDIEAERAIIHQDQTVLKVNNPADVAREGSMKLMHVCIVDPPDLLRIKVLEALPGRPITGDFLVRPDGRVNLGYYGEVFVAGLTPEQIKEKVVLHLRKYLSDDALGIKNEGDAPFDPKDSDRVSVDVAAYNSKVYYVQGDVGSPGRLPITGNETVLDAINFAGGLPTGLADSKVILVRPNFSNKAQATVLTVDMPAIVNRGDTTTNYQILPGDRLIIARNKETVPTNEPATRPQVDRIRNVEGRIDELIRELAELKEQIDK